MYLIQELETIRREERMEDNCKGLSKEAYRRHWRKLSELYEEEGKSRGKCRS